MACVTGTVRRAMLLQAGRERTQIRRRKDTVRGIRPSAEKEMTYTNEEEEWSLRC
jgi:hypothetical protein